MKLQSALARLDEHGAERQAVDAGEIDAIIDREGGNVILLPAARRALREAARRGFAPAREAPGEASHPNSLLAALPRTEYLRLYPTLETLRLVSGQVLHEPGAPIRHVYFPVDCVVSLLAMVDHRRSFEVALVGREGMIGISLALGVEVSSVRALVQTGGTVMRMEAGCFRAALGQSPSLTREMLRYAFAKLAQARQSAACNCFHSVPARLARWLLMMSDRVRSRDFYMTQAFMADLLGVRRATVNEAAGPLQRADLIRYSRGKISILDREGLEAAACPCYAAAGAERLNAAWRLGS